MRPANDSGQKKAASKRCLSGAAALASAYCGRRRRARKPITPMPAIRRAAFAGSGTVSGGAGIVGEELEVIGRSLQAGRAEDLDVVVAAGQVRVQRFGRNVAVEVEGCADLRRGAAIGAREQRERAADQRSPSGLRTVWRRRRRPNSPSGRRYRCRRSGPVGVKTTAASATGPSVPQLVTLAADALAPTQASATRVNADFNFTVYSSKQWPVRWTQAPKVRVDPLQPALPTAQFRVRVYTDLARRPRRRRASIFPA